MYISPAAAVGVEQVPLVQQVELEVAEQARPAAVYQEQMEFRAQAVVVEEFHTQQDQQVEVTAEKV
jgi:hypothetical protein